jgi:hypothetical protein
MRILVRWLLCNVVLLWSEEWGNARQEMQTRQAVYKIRTLCDAELRIFRVGLSDLERLQAEAARAIARFPAAQTLIVEMLQERMRELARTVNEQAAQKRTAA